MKSTMTDKPCKETITYPCLMKGVTTGKIVFFVAQNSGFVVSENIGSFLGKRCDELSEDNQSFKPFHGSVCLEND